MTAKATCSDSAVNRQTQEELRKSWNENQSKTNVGNKS